MKTSLEQTLCRVHLLRSASGETWDVNVQMLRPVNIIDVPLFLSLCLCLSPSLSLSLRSAFWRKHITKETARRENLSIFGTSHFTPFNM